MHLPRLGPWLPNRRTASLGSSIALTGLGASLGLLLLPGCTHLTIPSERNPAPAITAVDGRHAGPACRHAAGSDDAEILWPRFHPLPTGPLLGPGDPGWP